MTPRDHNERIKDILERINRIKYSEELLVQAENENNEIRAESALDAILYDLIVIGEAVKGLDAQMREMNADISWADISGMRDLLAHQYFRIDAAQVRLTIDQPLEDLRIACLKNQD